MNTERTPTENAVMAMLKFKTGLHHVIGELEPLMPLAGASLEARRDFAARAYPILLEALSSLIMMSGEIAFHLRQHRAAASGLN